MDGQVTWSDLGISCGKTWSEPSAATKEKTSRQSSKRSSKSSSRKPPVLKCLKRAGLPGGDTTMKWEDDGAWYGELMTRNTGECPNAVVVSRLSQILEANPLPKYNLTAKACLGILRRAERRGKNLPERLKAVLLMQSASGGGCDGGGKGALVQTEKSGTLGCGNDQTIFCLQGNGIDRADTAGCNGKGWKARDSVLCAYSFDSLANNSMKSKNPNSGCRETEIAKTLDTTNPDPSKNQGGIAVVALDMTHACDVICECGEQVPALQARMGTGGNQVPLTYQMNGFGDYRAAEVASSCKQRDFKDSTDLAITHMVVRRLTPMECERLQGFPDGWTDIGDWVKTDKHGREIKVKGSADSPRYKALGNSIALPFWDWMLRRMARYLPEDATLGSLFDGIAGFPLIWERIHGRGTARWASEIEEFPIAVTKLRFGEE